MRLEDRSVKKERRGGTDAKRERDRDIRKKEQIRRRENTVHFLIFLGNQIMKSVTISHIIQEMHS